MSSMQVSWKETKVAFTFSIKTQRPIVYPWGLANKCTKRYIPTIAKPVLKTIPKWETAFDPFLTFTASSRHFYPKQLAVIHTLMAVAAMHIRSSLGFSILPKDTLTCRPGNRTSDLLNTKCWLYPWATAANHQCLSFYCLCWLHCYFSPV